MNAISNLAWRFAASVAVFCLVLAVLAVTATPVFAAELCPCEWCNDSVQSPGGVCRGTQTCMGGCQTPSTIKCPGMICQCSCQSKLILGVFQPCACTM
jgi:hypothetical protein